MLYVNKFLINKELSYVTGMCERYIANPPMVIPKGYKLEWYFEQVPDKEWWEKVLSFWTSFYSKTTYTASWIVWPITGPTKYIYSWMPSWLFWPITAPVRYIYSWVPSWLFWPVTYPYYYVYSWIPSWPKEFTIINTYKYFYDQNYDWDNYANICGYKVWLFGFTFDRNSNEYSKMYGLVNKYLFRKGLYEYTDKYLSKPLYGKAFTNKEKSADENLYPMEDVPANY